jgi:hypothetical protein
MHAPIHNEFSGMNSLTRILCTTISVLLLFTFAAAPSSVQAQNEPGKVFLGVDGGLTQPTLGQGGTEADFLTGAFGGGHLMYNINRTLSFQLGAMYARRGGDNVFTEGDDNEIPAFDLEGEKYTLDYLDLSFLFKLTAPIEPVDGMKIRAVAGPIFGAMFDAELNKRDVMLEIQGQPEIDSRTRWWDIVGAVGGEIAIPIPRVQGAEVALNGQYHYGFTNIGNGDLGLSGFEYRNRNFVGSISLRFPLN